MILQSVNTRERVTLPYENSATVGAIEGGGSNPPLRGMDRQARDWPLMLRKCLNFFAVRPFPGVDSAILAPREKFSTVGIDREPVDTAKMSQQGLGPDVPVVQKGDAAIGASH